MLEYVKAAQAIEIWSAEQIREDSPEDTDLITDDQLGVLFHSGVGDGALVIGNAAELTTRFERVLREVGLYRPGMIVDGEVLPDQQPELPRRPALPPPHQVAVIERLSAPKALPAA